MSIKEDFILWKNNAITEAVFSAIERRAEILTEELVSSAGINALNDRYKAGYIQAIRDFSDLDLEDKEDA